jgi:hypothetical protein
LSAVLLVDIGKGDQLPSYQSRPPPTRIAAACPRGSF